jgi:hypothetical protein
VKYLLSFSLLVFGLNAFAADPTNNENPPVRGIEQGATPLMKAVVSDSTSVIEHLLAEGAPLNAQDAKGQTALMLAVEYAKDSTFVMLLTHHPNLELKDDRGNTPLIVACRLKKNAVATALILAGAEINATNKDGTSAPAQAADVGDTALVDLMKSRGAKQPDVHILAKKEPATPLTKSQYWALSVSAMYTQHDGLNPNILGGDPQPADETLTMFHRQWHVFNQTNLLNTVTQLRNVGDRMSFQREGAGLAAMSESEFAAELAEHPGRVSRLKAVRDSFRKWKERSGLAWDLCRASMLVNMGYANHFLTEKEAWDLLLPIAQDVQRNFSSWQEMTDNFLDGRKIWAGPNTAEMEACSKLLLNPKEMNSPWNQLSWKTNLSAPNVASGGQ